MQYTFSDFVEDWEERKREAVESRDYKSYEVFLRMVQKEFSRIYAKLERPELVGLVEAILKTASCEIKEIMIKYNKSKIPF